jgi:hypothetical protein
MTAVHALRRLIKLSFACTSWRKSRESLKEFLNRKEKIMTADLARLETMLGHLTGRVEADFQKEKRGQDIDL